MPVAGERNRSICKGCGPGGIIPHGDDIIHPEENTWTHSVGGGGDAGVPLERYSRLSGAEELLHEPLSGAAEGTKHTWISLISVGAAAK